MSGNEEKSGYMKPGSQNFSPTAMNKEEESDYTLSLNTQQGDSLPPLYSGSSPEIDYQPVFQLPEGFDNMNMVEQLRATMGFEFTPESMLADFKNDPAYGPSLRDSEAEAAFFANIQKTMEQMKNTSFEAFGFAPTKLDAPDVSFLAIPDHPQHVLRFYRGSKTLSQSLGVLFMDVCDAQTRRETIIPPNFHFVQQAMAGSLIEPGKIESMEWLQRRSSGIEQPARGSKEEIPEKFSLYEGSVCGLEIDGVCAMTFQVPRPGMSIARPIPAARFQFEVEK